MAVQEIGVVPSEKAEPDAGKQLGVTLPQQKSLAIEPKVAVACPFSCALNGLPVGAGNGRGCGIHDLHLRVAAGGLAGAIGGCARERVCAEREARA